MNKPTAAPNSPSPHSPHYPLDRRAFLVAGGLSYFGMNLAHAGGLRSHARRSAAAADREVGHLDLAQRRGLAHRYLGHEAECRRRILRAVSSHGHQRLRRFPVRTFAPSRPAGTPPGHCPLAGRSWPGHGRSSCRVLLQSDGACSRSHLPSAAQCPHAVSRRLAVAWRPWWRRKGRRTSFCPMPSRCRTRKGPRNTRVLANLPPGWESPMIRCSSREPGPSRSISRCRPSVCRATCRSSACWPGAICCGSSIKTWQRTEQQLAMRDHDIHQRRAFTLLGFPANANGLRSAARTGSGAGPVWSRHQRHVDAAGPPAGRGRRALCDGVLEGRPRTGSRCAGAAAAGTRMATTSTA